MGAGSDYEPMTFVEFLDEMKVVLEAGQRAFCLVAFDGVQPRDLPPEDREWARKVFGDVDEVPREALDAIGIVAGGRSGKTRLCSLRLVHLALTLDLSKIAPGQPAVAAIFSPRLADSEDALRYCAGACKAHSELAPMVIKDTSDELVLRRNDGVDVAIRALAAGAGGLSARGKSLVGVLLDETCFFKDKASGVVNDQAIYDAAYVRVIVGGQTMVCSTPWAGKGLLHTMWRENFGHPVHHLVAHASTRVMRSDPDQLHKVEVAYAKHPENAAIEFGAEWGATSAGFFFTDDELDAVFIDPPGQPRRLVAGEAAAAGADLGMLENSSCLGVLHRDLGGMAWLAALDEQRPEKGSPLKPSRVCGSFAEQMTDLGCSAVAADGHYRETLREFTDAAGIEMMKAPGTTESLVALRLRVREGKIRLWGDRLRDHMARIKQRRTTGNQITVLLPEDLDGSHADDVQAVANAAWVLTIWGGEQQGETPKEKTWNDREKEARERALRERARGRDQGPARWR